ncbi:hypothetical protein ACRAWF_28385 [Streptomyces sp. L7]
MNRPHPGPSHRDLRPHGNPRHPPRPSRAQGTPNPSHLLQTYEPAADRVGDFATP